jgi:hypothetical protein
MTFGAITDESGDAPRVRKLNSPLGLRTAFRSPRRRESKNWLDHVDFGGLRSVHWRVVGERRRRCGDVKHRENRYHAEHPRSGARPNGKIRSGTKPRSQLRCNG